MEERDLVNLTGLVLLAAFLIVGWFLRRRGSLAKTLQYATSWGLIFLLAIAGVGIWEELRSERSNMQATLTQTGQIELKRAFDGHYYATLKVNGEPVKFVVDTGASGVVLSHEDARRAGIDVEGLNYIGRASTANGMVRTAPVKLERIELAGIEDRNLRAYVNEGDMRQSLLGMEYLQRYSSIEITGGALILTR